MDGYVRCQLNWPIGRMNRERNAVSFSLNINFIGRNKSDEKKTKELNNKIND